MILRAHLHRASVIGAHPTSRAVGRGTLLVAALAWTLGCSSAEERCHAAQNAAQGAWSAYAAALTERKAQLVTAQADAQQRLRQMSGRIGAIATEETNRLYDRGPAWQRQYEVAFIQACRRDPDCAALEKERIRVDADAATLEKRLADVTGARNQALMAPQTAWNAAQSVEMESSDALSVAADKAAREAADTCDVTIQ